MAIKQITFEECGVSTISWEGGRVLVSQATGHALSIGVEYEDGARREVVLASGVMTELPEVGS